MDIDSKKVAGKRIPMIILILVRYVELAVLIMAT